ncbi:N-acetylglucosamine-6-phosphate deacetylase [Paenibacillus rhizovicinus]|uniref:N-acetylglucosamine-6-phosphate deacetylase n=1 Tax=Paenibacillus rhizovicinus TaxID=2704463 RepID=A0A6C0P4N0_9BACL|nr:N-acetylglucosamine-6-phosphate deacetylase [Paenibacillus rhizovicinus]QHW33449.1 N-acetylglucosamine-6-phosphate deacetylase [Paenibacillus rhizovicinus]
MSEVTNARPATWYVDGTVFTEEGKIEGGHVLVLPDGTIGAIAAELPQAMEENTRIIPLNGDLIIPGFVDVHVHGGNGFAVMEGTYEHLDGMSRFHASRGTTAFLATTGGAGTGEEGNIAALKAAAQAAEQGLSGAALAGIHMEGPFLNEKRKGAFKVHELRTPDLGEMGRYIAAAGGHLKLITVAPELSGGMELVRFLQERGVTVSIGHSDATFAEVSEAVRNGVTHTTHHFNGMRPLHHREPGVAGAGLILSELTTELIADGVHVHPALVKMLYEVKGEMNVCVVTDAVHCTGLPDGLYGRQRVSQGTIYLDGTETLAGSSLTMIQAFRNVLEYTGLPIEKVLPSLTLVPARQGGMDSRKGSIAVGKDADFLILDSELSLKATYVQGKEVYRNELI